MAELMLELSGITKTFPGVVALDNVHFELKKGEVHGLVGENGAGKSTLINIMSGLLQPDSGSYLLKGETLRSLNPMRARQLGIAVVHQEPKLVPHLSIAENVFSGRLPLTRSGFVDWPALFREARIFIKKMGFNWDPATPVSSLSLGERQIVAIIKALFSNAELIILDEPTPSLTMREVEILFEFVRELKFRGVSFVYISHYLEEVFRVCDRVTVMRDGRVVATKPVNELNLDVLVELMVGSVAMYPCCVSHPTAAGVSHCGAASGHVPVIDGELC